MLGRKKETTYEQDLLHFAWKLLENRVVFPKEEKKEAVWKETVEILGEMFPRGVLSFLAYRDGWKKKLHIRGNKLKTGRLWEHPEFKHLSLSFGEPSLQMMLHLFRAVAGGGNKKGKLVKYTREITQNGSAPERFLVHLMIRPLTRYGQLSPMVEQVSGWNGWNQMTVAVNPKFKTASNPSVVEATLQEWGWTFPWLAEDVASWWTRAHSTLFSENLKRYSGVMEKLTAVLEMVFKAAVKEGREDWLLPVMEFYKSIVEGYSEGPEKVTEPLELLIKEESHKTRQKYRDEWGEMLRFALEMEVQRQRLRRRHPVDRKAPQKLFLSHWETENMHEVLLKTEEMRVHLEHVVG